MECESGHYGVECKKLCPDCENGGVCRATSGTCVCPPGYYGRTCQEACRPGYFGSQCHMTCFEASPYSRYNDVAKACSGLTLCLPEPYGCSCAPGFKGPLCNQECGEGQYGAGCMLECRYCRQNMCNSITGQCTNGCLNTVPCQDGVPLDLPRLRAPPSVTNVQQRSARIGFSSWSKEEDDGGLVDDILSYLVQLQREDNGAWETKKTLTGPQENMEVTLGGLEPGHQYSVRVLVETQSGTVDDTTNKRIQQASFITKCEDPEVLDLGVSKRTNQSAFLTWRGETGRCRVNYLVELKVEPGGQVFLNKMVIAFNASLINLTPNTSYEAKITPSAVQRARAKTLNFSTLPNAPGQPDLLIESSGVNSRNLSWSLPTDSYNADSYKVQYQVVDYKACAETQPTQEQDIETNSSSVQLLELKSYAKYNVCVAAINSGGLSPTTCVAVETQAKPPSLQLSELDCYGEGNAWSCSAGKKGNCTNYNGPNITAFGNAQTFIECARKYDAINSTVSLSDSHPMFSLTDGLVAGQHYRVSLAITNDAGQGVEVYSNFTTDEDFPPGVVNLTAVSPSYNEVKLKWNDPCPSLGNITGYSYRHNNDNWINIANTSCKDQSYYAHCLTVRELSASTEYTFEVRASTNKGQGNVESVSIKTQDKVPGAPSGISTVRQATVLIFNISLPLDITTSVQHCAVDLLDTTHFCTSVDSNSTLQRSSCSVSVSGLSQGRIYRAGVFCCNHVGCGDYLKEEVATLPSPPELIGELKVKRKTNTNVTISLPTVQVKGEESWKVAVVVQHILQEQQGATNINFTDAYIKLQANRESESRAARLVERSEPHFVVPQCPATQDPYIAFLIQEDMPEVVVGSGTTVDGYHNCPLETGEAYMMAIVVVTELLGEKQYIEQQLKEAVVVEVEGMKHLGLAIALPLLIILALALLLVLYFVKPNWRLRRSSKLQAAFEVTRDSTAMELKGHGRRPAVQDLAPVPHIPHVFTTPATPQEPPETSKEMKAVYENHVPNDIYENVTRRIHHNRVEQYLNRVIGSHDIAEEFQSVPPNVGKSMADGGHPDNRKKNRYRNNLPYDETRVKLSVINNDPSSCYINANHVHGFGGALTYIASQGPKDAKLNTIGDFWRMVREQHVTVIIMVANFVEGGKNKVGEYIREGEPVEADGYTVTVTKTDPRTHYKVSHVQVEGDGMVHLVTHYHYTTWPDHGVPTEAHSLGTMLRHVIRAHPQGGIVVHCSAGIGRTGTVLLVLLLHEMLEVQGSIDPLEVLWRLRECRARLVENAAQYNLGLQIFDEILFGETTKLPDYALCDKLQTCLKESQNQYQRAKALPSDLTFRAASQVAHQPLNRSAAILPADTHRLYLLMKDGDPASQYINAVRLDSLDHRSRMVATEYPMDHTVHKFWQMVVEQQCANVVLINTFDGHFESFPSLLPEQDTDLVVGPYTLHPLTVTHYDGLMVFSLELYSQQEGTHWTTTVYQITCWQYGQEVPSSLEVLLTVADQVLQDPHCTLICCGDGVTGCGVMAGVLLTVERLQKYQEVDVYRTVVHLRRARPEFFTSQVQFELLYSVAATYLQEYHTYSNLKGLGPHY